MWQFQVDALRQDHYVVWYDVRGHGGSGTGDGQYTLELFVDDFIALLDHLRLRSVVGVGLSMGGYILLRAIERHPDRFRGLVLCDTRSEADGNEGKIRRAQQAAGVRANGVSEFADDFLKAAFHEATFAGKPDVVAGIRAVVVRPPRWRSRARSSPSPGAPIPPSLFRIGVPTLMISPTTRSFPSASQAYDKIWARNSTRSGCDLSNENPEFHDAPVQFPAD